LDGDPSFWDKTWTKGLGDWLELDFYEHIHALVGRLMTESAGAVLQTLRQTAMSGTSAQSFTIFAMVYTRTPLADGLQAVYNGVIDVLKRNKAEPGLKCRLLQSAVDIVGRRAQESKSLKLGDYMEICALVSDVWESNQKLVLRFLGQFTNRERKSLYFH